MKKIFVLYLILLNFSTLLAQPTYFSWKKPNFGWEQGNGFNYISPAKNQGEQGPCMIFAAVAAVEAMSQIYYHKPSGSGTFLNLSESIPLLPVLKHKHNVIVYVYFIINNQ